MSKPVKKKPLSKEQYPDWMLKLIRRQFQLDEKYNKAHSLFALAHNEFLLAIEDINEKYGTDFTLEQAIQEFGGEEAWDDEDDEDEDEEE